MGLLGSRMERRHKGGKRYVFCGAEGSMEGCGHRCVGCGVASVVGIRAGGVLVLGAGLVASPSHPEEQGS